ncbi:MAG: hypothetical protein ON057_001855 [Glomeribacter sp. 1016415]|nr:hypothetical protein [Glomeribacter sp. 1016415]
MAEQLEKQDTLLIKSASLPMVTAEGGARNATQLGRDVGNLCLSIIAAATIAGGAVKLAASLAKVGPHLGKKTLEEISKLSKFERLAKAEKNLRPSGTSLLDSSLPNPLYLSRTQVSYAEGKLTT